MLARLVNSGDVETLNGLREVSDVEVELVDVGGVGRKGSHGIALVVSKKDGTLSEIVVGDCGNARSAILQEISTPQLTRRKPRSLRRLPHCLLGVPNPCDLKTVSERHAVV